MIQERSTTLDYYIILDNLKFKMKGTFHETERVEKYNLDVFQTYWPNIYTF